MKDSKYRYGKKRNSSYSQESRLDEHITKYWIKSILSYTVTLITGLIAFFFLFPEVISKIFPSLNLTSSSFLTNIKEIFSSSLSGGILGRALTALLSIFIITILWFKSPYVLAKNQEVFCQRKMFFPFFYRISSIALVSQVSSENATKYHYASKTHESFSQTLALNIDHVQMVVSKHESILVYFSFFH
ncbi:MAG: hypothetical protein H7641_07800 [Candidatus Heimdallarchaeota archaeon]|nr:hypothetical protein [Candidatus Heimdallarchaeota archaeon]MCK4877466.1 hypothetical protein [Candidatus Heimdallarchaeota archaeon]